MTPSPGPGYRLGLDVRDDRRSHAVAHGQGDDAPMGVASLLLTLGQELA
jgi:hypothetical protein